MDHRDEVATFDPTFAEAGYARLYCDLPGMGRSAGMAVPSDLNGFLDAILALVRDEIGDRPFVLAGTSAGAYLARGVAARLGAQVRGMVLRVPLVHPARRDRDAPVVLRDDADVMAGLDQAQRAVLEQPPLVQASFWIDDLTAKLQATVVPAMQAANQDALARVRDNPRRYVLSGADDWPDFTAPALIVAGRQDDSVGWRDAMRLCGTWPRASIAVLDMAGHEFPLAFQMPLFQALLRDFLHRLEVAP